MKKLLSILAAVAFTAIGCRAATLAQQADSAYMSEQFDKAVELYRRSLNEEAATPATYYNLGNAYWRNGDAGHAIINYERALALDPSYGDARTNLQFVRTKIQDLPEDDSSFLSHVHENIMAWMSPDAWAWTAFVLFLAVAAMAAIYIFSTHVTLRKAGFFGGIALLFLTAYAIAVASQSASAHLRHNHAVVVVPTTHLSSSPKAAQATDKVVAIHEGTKVEIVDSVMAPGAAGAEKWYDVKINNSSRAWLRAADVEKI